MFKSYLEQALYIHADSALPFSKALIYLILIFIRTFFSRYSRSDLVSGLLWFKEQF